MHSIEELLLYITIITVVLYSALQDCLLRSAPSPASVKHSCLEGREEGDGVMNMYLAKSNMKYIPGRRTSNRKVTALPSCSPRPGNNKFRPARQSGDSSGAGLAWWSNRAHASMEGLGPQCSA